MNDSWTVLYPCSTTYYNEFLSLITLWKQQVLDRTFLSTLHAFFSSILSWFAFFRIFTALMIARCSKTADFTDYHTLFVAQNSPTFQWSISHFSELFPHLYICVRIFSCIFTALMIARCSKTADFTDYHIFLVAQKRPTFQWRYRTFLSFSFTYAYVIFTFFCIFAAQMITTTVD